MLSILIRINHESYYAIDQNLISVNVFVKSITTENERNIFVQKCLYANFLNIDMEFIMQWISDSLEKNELRQHDDIIRKAIACAGDTSTGSSYYLDLFNNKIIGGIKYNILSKGFLMEKELLSQIRTLWAAHHSSIFHGHLLLNQHNKASYFIMLILLLILNLRE